MTTKKYFASMIVGGLVMLNPGLIMSQENDKIKRYFLSVKTQNVKAVIGVNGAPLVKDIEGEGIITTEPVNTWLPPGKNQLVVKLSRLDGPTGKSKPVVYVGLYLHDSASDTPSPKKVIAEYRFPNKQHAKDIIESPLIELVDFQFEDKLPVKLWSEAANVKFLDSRDKREIVELVNQLQGSLLNKQIDKAIQLQEYKIADDAAAEHKTESQLKSATRKSYEMLAKESALKGDLLTIDTTRFEICCDDRLVYISRESGKDAVSMESDDMYFDIDVYVAKINNKWVIVR